MEDGWADAMNSAGMVTMGSLAVEVLSAGCFKAWQMGGEVVGEGGGLTDGCSHPVVFISLVTMSRARRI